MYWILLVAGAAGMAVYVIAKICHRQLATSDAVFWFFFSFFLIVMAVFPKLIFALSSALGFESPANFVFLCVLVVVICRQLAVSVEIARQRARLTALVQHMALRDSEDNSANDGA